MKDFNWLIGWLSSEWMNVLLIIVIWYLIQFLVLLCARQDIFWTVMVEGYSKIITRNDKFYKALLSYTGHMFQGEETGVIPTEEEVSAPADLSKIEEETKGEKKEVSEPDNLDYYEIVKDKDFTHSDTHTLWEKIKSIVFPASGVEWIGIPGFYAVYKHPFVWTDDKYKVRGVDEIFDKTLVQQYVYGILLPSIELQGGLPFFIKVQVVLRIINPAKANFRIGRWFDATIERITALLRPEFGDLAYEDFVSASKDISSVTKTTNENDEKKTSSLEQAIDRVMVASKKDITKPFGVEVVLIQVSAIDPVDDLDLRKLTILLETKKREAQAGIIESQGKAEALRIYNEQASMTDAKTMGFATLETIQKTGSNITIVGEGHRIPTTFTIPLQGDGNKKENDSGIIIPEGSKTDK